MYYSGGNKLEINFVTDGYVGAMGVLMSFVVGKMNSSSSFYCVLKYLVILLPVTEHILFHSFYHTI